MPHRYIREGINSSRAVASLDAAAEVLYRRLLNVVDDYGRFEVDAKLIRSQAYPVHYHISEPDILRWLAACQKAGLLVIYETAGRKYLVLTKIERPRAKRSRFPEPLPHLVQLFNLFTEADTGSHVQTSVGTRLTVQKDASNTDTNTIPNAGAEAKQPPPPSSEVPTEEQAIAMTATVGVPPDFVKFVYADWSSRQGKDAAGIPIAWLNYVTKRWIREQNEWKAGTHSGKKTGRDKPRRTAGAPAQSEVVAYAKEKWGDDPNHVNWAVSFYAHWNGPKRNWQRHGVLIDWKIELSVQAAKWRGP